jgi:hypothetical protein
MEWRILVAALCCAAAAGAQTPGQNAASKLQPYQLKALENALHGPKTPVANSLSAPFAALPRLNGPVLFPARSAPREIAKACAIPLVPVPINSNVDPGIRRKLDPKAFSADSMPVAKGLPACPQDHQPVR